MKIFYNFPNLAIFLAITIFEKIVHIEQILDTLNILIKMLQCLKSESTNDSEQCETRNASKMTKCPTNGPFQNQVTKYADQNL